MRIATGRVVHGKIELDAEQPVAEGARVTVLVQDPEERFELDEDQTAELLAAIDEANRGEVVDADEVLAELRAQ